MPYERPGGNASDRVACGSVGRGTRQPSLPPSRTTTGEDSSSVSDTDADEMEEHPRGLGYLE